MSGSDKRWPDRVYGSGDEPDPRMTLANERTFLAWIRTSLALLAGAAAVHALDLSVSDTVQRCASALLALAALLTAAHAWRNWAATETALRHRRPLPSNAVGVVLAGAVAAVAIIMIAVGARG